MPRRSCIRNQNQPQGGAYGFAHPGRCRKVLSHDLNLIGRKDPIAGLFLRRGLDHDTAVGFEQILLDGPVVNPSDHLQQAIGGNRRLGGFLFDQLDDIAASDRRGSGGTLCSYTRSGRRLNATQNNYCSACQNDKVPQQQADLRRRRRMQQARVLHRQGVSLDEIAQRLHTKPDRVARWLKKRVRKSSG